MHKSVIQSYVSPCSISSTLVFVQLFPERGQDLEASFTRTRPTRSNSNLSEFINSLSLSLLFFTIRVKLGFTNHMNDPR